MLLPGLDSNFNRRICDPTRFFIAGIVDEPWRNLPSLRSCHGDQPLTTFWRCIPRYRGEHKVKFFLCLEQYLCTAFAQLNYRESRRHIEACLRAQSAKLYHLGIRGQVARNTLAKANTTRDWCIYSDFAQRVISIARRLYTDEPFGIDLSDTVYALDATTIAFAFRCFSRHHLARPRPP